MMGTLPVRRRMVGVVLRRYREGQGYTLEDAARALECDHSKISRIETGQRGVQPAELRVLLAGYGVEEPERRALAAFADPRAARGWWQGYADVLAGAFREYLVLEAMAWQVLVYDSQRVPGLLQTRPYARAVAAGTAGPEVLRDGAAEAVLARQRAFAAREHRGLTVVIGEGALRQEVGGSGLMRGQLAHLAAVSKGDAGLEIRVLPLTSGAHAAAGGGPAVILRFAPPSGLGAVYLDGPSGGVILDSEADVDGYAEMFTRLRASALTPQESTRLFRDMVSA